MTIVQGKSRFAALKEQFKAQENAPIPRRLFILLLFAVIGLGIALRLLLWRQAGALLLDEVLIILNVRYRDYGELMMPLDYNQGAPLGFLWLQHFLSDIVAPHFTLLRLVSTAGSIFALLLFPVVALKMMTRRAALLGTFLLACTTSLLFFMPLVKQYSSDVMATILALYLLLHLYEEKVDFKGALWIGGSGALLLLFSHSVIFVLAGGGLALLFKYLYSEDKDHLPYLLFSGALWLLAFLTLYLFSLRNLVNNEALFNFWQGAGSFPPPAAQPLLFARWFAEKFLLFFDWQPLYFRFQGLAITFFVLGIFSFWKRDKWLLLLLILPIVFTFIAAALQLYPLFDRLTLFLVPLLVVALAEGLERLLSLAKGWTLKAAAVTIIALLLLPLLWRALNFEKGGAWDKDILPAMEQVHQGWQEGDMFIYTRQMPYGPVFLYLARYPFEEQSMINLYSRPETYRASYSEEIERLQQRYGRIWLFFAMVAEEDVNEDREDIIQKFGGQAVKMRTIDLQGSDETLYLFDYDRPGSGHES